MGGGPARDDDECEWSVECTGNGSAFLVLGSFFFFFFSLRFSFAFTSLLEQLP